MAILGAQAAIQQKRKKRSLAQSGPWNQPLYEDEEEVLGYVQGINRWQDDDSLNLDQKEKLRRW